MNVPADLLYTKDHEWLRIESDTATVGVTAFAADALGDIVYVDLPGVGTTLEGGDSCGEIESTKSVSDLYAPVEGEVLEVNDKVVRDPGLVNTDPFNDGWLLKLRVSTTVGLLDAHAYAALLEQS